MLELLFHRDSLPFLFFSFLLLSHAKRTFLSSPPPCPQIDGSPARRDEGTLVRRSLSLCNCFPHAHVHAHAHLSASRWRSLTGLQVSGRGPLAALDACS